MTTTRRMEAERIADEYASTHTLRKLLTDAIDRALRARDERAAKIAEKSHQQPCICTTCLIHAEIAAAIRRETNANHQPTP